jgi:hypothetical protein
LQGFEIRYENGDLFSSPDTDALAHCVSEDLVMGKGIAKIFKERFRGVGDLVAQGTLITIDNVFTRILDKFLVSQ